MLLLGLPVWKHRVKLKKKFSGREDKSKTRNNTTQSSTVRSVEGCSRRTEEPLRELDQADRSLRVSFKRKNRKVRIHTLGAVLMNGLWKVKDPKLKVLHAKAKKLASTIAGLKIVHIPKERNAEADRLANEAIDVYSNG